MVRALLDGRKTQTRRIINPQPSVDGGWEEPPGWALEWKDLEDGFLPEELARLCPYGKPGDLLWVREPWRVIKDYDPFDSEAILLASGGDMVGCVDYTSTSSSPE